MLATRRTGHDERQEATFLRTPRELCAFAEAGENGHGRERRSAVNPDSGTYCFHHGISALVEMSTSNARQMLPTPLVPLERQHERSVLSITIFDFYESDCGPYSEVVLAIVVPPLIRPGGRFPKAAFFPFAVATSTERSRREGIERWHLPHFPGDVGIDMAASGDQRINARVTADGRPVLDLTVTATQWMPASILFHTFMAHDGRLLKSDLIMEGQAYSEHERERGSLTVFRHDMTSALAIDELGEQPFREQWMRDGKETFCPLAAV